MEMLKSVNDKYVAREMPLEPTKEGFVKWERFQKKNMFATNKVEVKFKDSNLEVHLNFNLYNLIFKINKHFQIQVSSKFSSVTFYQKNPTKK